MIDQGLLKRKALGDLRDLIGRRFDEGGVISVQETDTLVTAFNRMRSAEISQLPVIKDDKVIGVIDESDVLLKVANDVAQFRSLVDGTMTHQIETLSPDTSIEKLRATLDRGLVAIIADRDTFYGLITRFDLLNHLRRTLS
jgi:cystathionine beta-synthase